MSARTTVTGELVREPEIRYTREGKAVTQLAVVDAQSTASPDEPLTVIVWNALAENVALSLTKGMAVIATGHLEIRTWETEGQRRTAVELYADDVGPSLLGATADVRRIGGRP